MVHCNKFAKICRNLALHLIARFEKNVRLKINFDGLNRVVSILQHADLVIRVFYLQFCVWLIFFSGTDPGIYLSSLVFLNASSLILSRFFYRCLLNITRSACIANVPSLMINLLYLGHISKFLIGIPREHLLRPPSFFQNNNPQVLVRTKASQEKTAHNKFEHYIEGKDGNIDFRYIDTSTVKNQ